MWRWGTSTLAPRSAPPAGSRYSGLPEVTNYDDIEEIRPGHVLVVDVDESRSGAPGAGVRAAGVGRWRFLTLRHDVNDDRDIAGLDVNLDQLPDKERTVVQLVLTGSLTVTDKAKLDACLDRYARAVRLAAVVESGTPTSRCCPADGEFDDLVDRRVRRRRGGRNWWPPRAPTAPRPRTPGRRSRCCCACPAATWRATSHEAAPAGHSPTTAESPTARSSSPTAVSW